MILLPQIRPDIIKILKHTPIQHLLKTIEQNPVSPAMLYADQKNPPNSCVMRIGPMLLCGGEPSDHCLAFIRDKILTFEIYEKYGSFCFFYSSDLWRKKLVECFPERGRVYEHFLQAPIIPAISGVLDFHLLEDRPAFYLDLQNLHRAQKAPSEEQVYCIARSYLPDLKSVHRVPEGASTYVYRITTSSGRVYARFLPEDTSFASEVLAHKLMSDQGVTVPPIIAYEPREARTGFSMMLAGEIAGNSIEQKWPQKHLEYILREAGKQLALIHTIPVKGFGWIHRNMHDALIGEKESFQAYFSEYLENDLTTLHYYDFTYRERAAVQAFMLEALCLLNTEGAVLVHGDFDISHIFYSGNQFSGFIDFGEIRGNHRFFDLATFSLNDTSEGKQAYSYLLSGYQEVFPLTDLRAVELMGLLIALRFAGKKVETASRDHWFRLIKKQLEILSENTL